MSLNNLEMDSLPMATTPQPVDDTVVLSPRLPEQGEVTLETPQGRIPHAGYVGYKIPADRADESCSKPGSQPEPSMVSDAGRRPLAREGELSVPMTSGMPEASDGLLEVLRGASLTEEHRTLMSAVIQKVLSAKSGLTEACTNLLMGFEVSNKSVKLSPDR